MRSPPSAPSHEAESVELVEIPGTALKVSRVALGTWAIGGWMWGSQDPIQSVATVHMALDQGINLIDTAPIYGFGVAEEIVGRALRGAGLRQRTIIATKAGIEWRDGKAYRNASRERIFAELHDSLRRLRTDYIDIYQVHWPDPLVPVQETADAMQTLYKHGKIRAIGVSNFSVEEMERFAQAAPLHVLQSPYNLFERGIEISVLPFCRTRGVVTLGYGALCRGLLSGRMRVDTAFSAQDVRHFDPKFQPCRLQQYLKAVGELDRIAGEYGRTVVHLAVRWMLDQEIDVALWGARDPRQLSPVSGVWGWSLDRTTRMRIERVLEACITEPVGPEFMAPPPRRADDPAQLA